MKKETPISLRHLRRITAILFLCPISLSSIQASAASDQSDVSSASVHQEQTLGILRAEKINPTTVDVLFANQQRTFTERIFSVSFRTIPEALSVTPKRNLKHRYL